MNSNSHVQIKPWNAELISTYNSVQNWLQKSESHTTTLCPADEQQSDAIILEGLTPLLLGEAVTDDKIQTMYSTICLYAATINMVIPELKVMQGVREAAGITEVFDATSSVSVNSTAATTQRGTSDTGQQPKTGWQTTYSHFA